MAVIGSYSATRSPVETNTKLLKPDAKGYYRQIVGGFNMETRGGIEYPISERIIELFENDGALQRKVLNGQCYGEEEHPDIRGMNTVEALTRLADIRRQNRCVHHRKFVLDYTKDENKKPIVLVYGELTPSGPKAEILLKTMENPEENAAFSIRSFVDTIYIGKRVIKQVKSIVTYDNVTEAGVGMATQFDTAGLESFGTDINFDFTQGQLDDAIGLDQSSNVKIGLEDYLSDLVMVKTEYGWNKVNRTTLASAW